MVKRPSPQVVAVDPESRTAPIWDDQQEFWLDPECKNGVCHFNDVALLLGRFVLRGRFLLPCERRGLSAREADEHKG